MHNWFLKLSQHSDVKLEKGVHTASKNSIYFLTGNTYPLHKSVDLKTFGFQWWAAKKMWWMYSSKMSPSLLQRLSSLGINTSAVNTGQPTPSHPVTEPIAPSQDTSTSFAPSPAPVESPASNSADVMNNTPSTSGSNAVVDTSDADIAWEDKEMSRRAGFPIKSIYTKDIEIQFDGQPVTLTAKLQRWAKQGVSGHRSVAKGWANIPLYSIEVFLQGDTEHLFKVPIPINREADQTKRRWNEINEGAEIVPLIDDLVKRIFVLPNSKGSNILRTRMQIASRDPELIQFIKDHDAYGTAKQAIVKDIHLDTSEYQGNFPIQIVTHGSDTWWVYPKLDHPLAPQSNSFAYWKMPSTIQTVPQWLQFIDKMLADPQTQADLQDQYIRYLNSFPYSQEAQIDAKQQFEDVAKVIQSRNMDTMFFRNKLLEHGYLRPSKRMKASPGGLVPQDKVKIIFDTAKILADIYDYGKTAQVPNFFYATVAYYMHRLKSGNIGFMPIQIMDSMRDLSTILGRYGLVIKSYDLEQYIEELAKKLLRELFSLGSSTAWDNWTNFYSGNWGTGHKVNDADDTSVGQPNTNSLENFAQFAQMHGLNSDEVLADPHSAYKRLSIQLHPDRHQQDPDGGVQAEADFKQLQSIWNTIKSTVRQSSYMNWMVKIAYSVISSSCI